MRLIDIRWGQYIIRYLILLDFIYPCLSCTSLIFQTNSILYLQRIIDWLIFVNLLHQLAQILLSKKHMSIHQYKLM